LDASEILHQLTHDETLPRAALAAASERRDEMVPLFIGEIEKFLAAGPERNAWMTPLFFAFHLLGEWRETSAYRPLARLLRCADIESQLGDATTETSHRVMAAVFDGDARPLCDVILDNAADEYCRASMISVLVMLVREGRLARAAVETFVRECETRLLPRTDCFVWMDWVEAIADLGMSDMVPAVKRLFDDAVIDPEWATFEWFERLLRDAQTHPDRIELDRHHVLFGNTIDELSRWYAYSEGREQDRRERGTQRMPAPSWDTEWLMPKVNVFGKVGRNDPCPCGSGKKFKKCCLSS
jgi:hypothetical protein